MINLGMIGLGTIFHWQYEALCRFDNDYRVHAVYDLNIEHARECVAKTDIQIYKSIEELLNDDIINAVAIITPPATHTEIAKQCLLAGKHVLLEKPATLSMEELDELYCLAKENGVLFKVAYHASFALDVEWYLENCEKIHKKCGLGHLTKMECGFYDPYTRDGKVMPEKYALCGSFIDSAVNALSVCARLMDLDTMELVSKTEEKENAIVYVGNAIYNNGECEMIIHTAWNLGLNQKTTELSFEGSDKKVLLHHSKQSVFLCDGDKCEVLFEEQGQERLLNHYLGVYRSFASAYEKFSNSKEQYDEVMTKDIHRLLLETRVKSYP